MTAKDIWELVVAGKVDEAFRKAYDNGIFMGEDWVEIDGIEYYDVYVEDDRFRFEI